ncbi:MAG TPA: LytR family transcriptional regulator, partial [Enterococcus gallinarum]|nr:LytR family transcriptional regulator [Enterococcus gallinarum]
SIVYIQDYSYNEIRNDMLKALGQLDETTSENQGTTTDTSTNY